jgi:S-DNA-T family DNA segregation ATPase FtsK/SpoIIIE
LSQKKSFFDSPEWRAFVRPFRQLINLFRSKNDEPDNAESISQPTENSQEQSIPTQAKRQFATPEEKEALELKNQEVEKQRLIDEEKRQEVEKQRLIDEEKRQEEEEEQREEFLLSKFERRKLEREKRKKSLDGLEETMLDPDRPTLAEKQDFPQYSLEDFMKPDEEEHDEIKKRELVVPEGGFQFPKCEMLDEVPVKAEINKEEIERKKNLLQDTLDSFKIDALVSGASMGPRITRIDIRPAQGVNVDSIAALSKNMAMELEAESLRVLAPIPGKPFVGVEIPNDKPEKVSLRELLESSNWHDEEHRIPLALGKNTSGEIKVMDLAKAPHLLIAGATGAGKSVCINTIVMSMIFRLSPEELQLIMVDPKVVELTAYEKLPHLIAPVITDTTKVRAMLVWVVAEMKRRYKILALAGARNIASYNSREISQEPILDEDEIPIPDKFPSMVVIIDELADIMMTSGPEVETALAQIAQLSRAVGIHTIVATQRPSVNVITGIIKANFPTRIAFQVSSHVDSRTIIDGKGAEQLLGRGDMLLVPPGAAVLERLQGALVEDDEIDSCVEFLSNQMEQVFDPGLEAILTGNFDGPSSSEGGGGAADDDLIKKAIDIIASDRKASTSYLQRRLRIGYNRAATVMEKLEEMGVVGPQIGSAAREIFIE